MSGELKGREGLAYEIQKLDAFISETMKKIQESLERFDPELVTYKHVSKQEFLIELVNCGGIPLYVRVYSISVRRLFMEWGFYYRDENGEMRRREVTKSEIVRWDEKLVYMIDSAFQNLCRLAANVFIDKIADTIINSDISIVFDQGSKGVCLVNQARAAEIPKNSGPEILK